MHDLDTRKRIAVIADDLTGANDTGVQFAKQGLKTIVLMGRDFPSGTSDDDVVVMDSQSRSLTPAEAYREVAEMAAQVRDGRFHTVFKKIDSTLRGNIGPEIDAIMDTCGQDLAVVVPAFPKNGRTTVGGHLLVHGAPLETTEAARIPGAPSQSPISPPFCPDRRPAKWGMWGLRTSLPVPRAFCRPWNGCLPQASG